MSNNVTHIYRVDMSHNPNTLVSDRHWVYARNAKIAKEYCKQKFKDRHYDHFNVVMVGENNAYHSQEASSLSDKEICCIENTPAKDGDKYVYHRNEVPGL